MPLLKPPLGAQLRRDHPLAAGLVGAWLFNEGSGNRVFDYSGNGNHGTLTNMDPATDWVPGPSGMAVDTDGVNDYVAVPGMPAWTAGGVTLFARVSTNSATADAYAIGGRITTESGWRGNICCLICGYQVGYWNLFHRATYPTGTASESQMAATAGTFQSVSYAWYPGWVSGAIDGNVRVNRSANAANTSAMLPTYSMNIGAAANTAVPFGGKFESVMLFGCYMPPAILTEHHADPYAMFRERRRWWMFGQTAGGISVPWHLLQGRAA